MVMLSDADKRFLEEAVKAAEARTSAELVLAVADVCDDYRLHTVPYAAVLGFVVFGGLALFVPDLHVRVAFLLTGAVTLATGAALQWLPLRLLTVPRAAREDAAERLAREEFVALVQGRTAAANGLLIFVALAEHHAEIVPDSGLAARVPQATWQKIMDDLLVHVRAGRVAEGLKGAIMASGDAAAAAFPPSACDANEIADAPHLVPPE
ncbi:MAG: TPM domain-containing protein [Rhodospirillaceae bacterium]